MSTTDFFPNRPAATLTIYAFSSTPPDHAGLLKVGYTERDAAERIAEQWPGGLKAYRIELIESAMRPDGTSFTDRDIHRHLRARNNWLNPPEWTTTEVLEFPGTVGGPWDRYIDPATVAERKTGDGETIRVGTVKYPRIVPKDEQSAKELKKRTLTNLYNERPTWLDLVHKKLDEAVFAAYGWSPEMTDDELLAALLELNLKRAAEEGKK